MMLVLVFRVQKFGLFLERNENKEEEAAQGTRIKIKNAFLVHEASI